MASGPQSRTLDVSVGRTTFHTVEADGVRVFYREKVPADAPVLLFLHDFPSSSHMFHELIPRMATRYPVIAPDLPGFGFTTVPEERGYRDSLDSLAATVQDFVDALSLKRYALYVFDFGMSCTGAIIRTCTRCN